MLKLAYHTILLQEVPGEISLGLVFSGCPIKCPDCHSKEFWDIDSGKDFNLESLLHKYTDMITCVCFMGGDWEEDSLNDMLRLIKINNLKTCLYTGSNTVNFNKIGIYLDYLKLGPYIKECGGLQSPNTNQQFFKISKTGFIDITSTFEVK